MYSKLIYYNAIYKIETKKPNDTKAVKKFLNEELRKLKRYFDNNLEFYKYYRTNNNFIDEKLFIRGKCDIKLNIDTYYFETDHRFSTSQTYSKTHIKNKTEINIPVLFFCIFATDLQGN